MNRVLTEKRARRHFRTALASCGAIVALLSTTMPIAAGATVLHPHGAQHETSSSKHEASTRPTSHSSLQTADEGTNLGGLSRDGWYPEATALTPYNVQHDNFGRIFTDNLVGQIYAQPVMDQGNVIVATEENWVYAINQVTGAVAWSVQVGANIGAQPFNDVNPTASTLQGWYCTDLAPYIGITSTPVVDPSTGVIYLVAMEQLPNGTLGYYVHALNPSTGGEMKNFPVQVQGTAQNNPNAQFVAWNELQRVSLTLLDGVVYFGFSSHCDSPPYQGYVAGVSEAGRMTALWTPTATNDPTSGGLWQAGSAFSSDGSGQLLIAVGNGDEGSSPAGVIPGHSPPQALGESNVRLEVQSDGSLVATDFFTPYDSLDMDQQDLDYGAGAPALLPSSFGTSKYPDLLVQTGKEGVVYLLNHNPNLAAGNSLGGVGMGAPYPDPNINAATGGTGDASLSQIPNFGAGRATPSVWPGDGGYIYLTTGTNGVESFGNGSEGDFNVFQVHKHANGNVDLTFAARGPEALGYGTSGGIVTSNGTKSGSAVVWVNRLPSGAGQAQLQAYNAVPSRGSGTNPGTLSVIGDWPIGNGNKFTAPGVGDNRIYVANHDGQLIAFGLNAPTIVKGPALSYTATGIGKSLSMTRTFQTSAAVTISSAGGACGICTRTSQYKVVSTTPAFRGGVLSLAAHQRFTVTVAFAPTGNEGLKTDVLRMVTSNGEADFVLTGIGEASTPWVAVNAYGVNEPGYTIGQRGAATTTLRYTNFGLQPAVVLGATAPSRLKPFSVSGVPKVGSLIAPGASFTVTVSFSTTTPGTYATSFSVTTNSPGTQHIQTTQLNAEAQTPGVLGLDSTTPAPDFGGVNSGGSSVLPIQIDNTGGAAVTLESVSTTSTAYQIQNPLPGPLSIPGGSSTTVDINFQPPGSGTYAANLVAKTSTGTQFKVPLAGFGVGAGYAIPAPGSKGWQYSGNAQQQGSTLQLTPLENFTAGSAFWPVPVTSGTVAASFTANAALGSGGDGMALVLADASAVDQEGTLSPLGGNGGDEGFGGNPGITGLAVIFGECTEANVPYPNFIGIADGTDQKTGNLHYVKVVPDPNTLQDTSTPITVTIANSTISVYLNGQLILKSKVNLPPSFLVGFVAGNGSIDNLHLVSNTDITVGGTKPSVTLTPSPATVSFPVPGATTYVGNIDYDTVTLTNNSMITEAITTATVAPSTNFTVFPFQPQLLAPGATAEIQVLFQPTVTGTSTATLSVPIVGSNVATTIPLTGTAIGTAAPVPSFTSANWTVAGSATWQGSSVQLTSATAFQAGTCVENHYLGSPDIAVSFNLTVSNPNQNYSGADGSTVFFADAPAPTNAVGKSGGDVGFANGGLHGLAVVINEEGEAGTNGGNFITIADGGTQPLYIAPIVKLPQPLFGNTIPFSVTESTTEATPQSLPITTINVFEDGVHVMTYVSPQDEALTPNVRVGFSAGTGQITDVHSVSNVIVSAARTSN